MFRRHENRYSAAGARTGFQQPLDQPEGTSLSVGDQTDAPASLGQKILRLWIGALYQDLKFACRILGRRPQFTAAIISTLALGIGANAAIFSVIDNVLFRSLPLPSPDQIVAVYNYSTKSSTFLSTSYPDYEDYRASSGSFQQLSAYVRLPARVRIGDHLTRVSLEAVTANYFSMLNLPPLAGSSFESGLDRGSDRASVVMLGEDLWRSRFRADPAVLGKTVQIEGEPFTIVGIVPKRYQGTNLSWVDTPEMWIPLSATAIINPRIKEMDILHRREARWLLMIGRLRQGGTVAKAQAELRTLAANIARRERRSNADITAVVFSANRSKFWPAYQSAIVGSLAVFAGAAILVLSLACLNVSNLLVERALARRKEIAIRLSIGASRARLIRQLVVETLAFALPSYLTALLVAYALQKVLLHFPNALGLTMVLNLEIEWRVASFCFALTLAAATLLGIAPALRATRSDVLPTLKGFGSAARARWLASWPLIVQVAFSMILLVGGGLFARSLLRAYSTALGFQKANLLLIALDMKPEETSGEQGPANLQSIMQQMSNFRGVESVTVASAMPLNPVHESTRVTDAANTGAAPLIVDYDGVGQDFLKTLGIPLVVGRDFTSRDTVQSGKVAIVNQALADKLWPGGNPIGHAIWLQGTRGPKTLVEVVGIARNAKYRSVWEQPQPYLYLPALQLRLPAGYLMVRTWVKPETLIPTIRQQWQRMVPQAPLGDIRTGSEQVDFSLTPQRLAAGLLGSFAALALLLASVGLYSVLACSVTRRTRDIGIRIAVGARPQTVIGHVLGHALSMVAAGLVLGGAASAALARLIASQVKGVTPYDAFTFGCVTLLVLVVSAFAALPPALRAASIDPVAALKYE